MNGGEDADRLEGGPGIDTYLLSGTLDADTIVDRDGWIYAGANLLTGGSGEKGGPYVSSDGRFRYEFSGDLASAGTLVVNGSLRVEGFRNGDLGIRLAAISARGEVSELATGNEFLGDYLYEPIIVPPDEIIFADPYGNPLPQTRTSSAPGRQETEADFKGTPGNDHFIVGGGNVRVRDRFGGDDWIETGDGNDVAFGGDGNDLLEGGPGRDALAGDAGDDVLIAGTIATRDADLEATDPSSVGQDGDGLFGGVGDDVVYGDARGNVISGGYGSDRIYAGAGDDAVSVDR